MTNLKMLLDEFCGMQELSRYMDTYFPEGWDEYDLKEECDTNIEHVLEFLGIRERTWNDAFAELENEDDDDSWDMNEPDGPWTFQPEHVENWW